MPIIRKILKLGNSKAVTIPATWLEFYERDDGCEITEVAIEINERLTITPILPKKEVAT